MIRFVISLQISMLQDELSRLTLTELDKREERQDVERVCNLVFHSSIKIWNQKGRPWMETTKRILTYSFSRRVVLTLIEFTLRSDISRKWTPLSMIKWRDCNCYGFKAIRPFLVFDCLLAVFISFSTLMTNEKCGLQKRKAHEVFRKWVGSVGTWRKNNCKLLGVCGGIFNSKTSASYTTGRILFSLLSI